MERQKKNQNLIRISDCQSKILINKKAIKTLAEKTLQLKGVKAGELSILFAGQQRMRSLNRIYRNHDSNTDVLAFSMCEGQRGADPASQLLGDIVICPKAAEIYARRHKTDLKTEIDLYLIHGILHLLGYQDQTPKNRLRMEKEQKRILNKIAS